MRVHSNLPESAESLARISQPGLELNQNAAVGILPARLNSQSTKLRHSFCYECSAERQVDLLPRVDHRSSK